MIGSTIGRNGPARTLDLVMYGKLQTLEEVLRWAHALGYHLVEVVTQDEYTHDVVVAAGARWIVFDTT